MNDIFGTGAGYDRMWADVYGEMQDLGPVHRHMRRLLIRLLESVRYKSAIEIGCGAGHNFPLLAGHTAPDAITGVDISPDALARARSTWPQIKLEVLDIQAGALPGSWDLVFCSLVLEHLEDDEAALRNMREMSSDSLVLSTIAGDYQRFRPWEEQVGHVRNYRRGELEAKLERAGFRVERTIYWGAPFYSPLIRLMQNYASASPSYGPMTRLAARFLYALYWLNSARRGDLLLVHARTP